jgi:integrase
MWLITSAVATIVKQHAAQVGLDPVCLSGHSLRAGFATSAAVARLPLWRIRRQTGHVSEAVLNLYIREHARHQASALGSVLLDPGTARCI